MNRLLALLSLMIVSACLVAPVSASELVFASAGKPSASVNFDGSHHLDISHNKHQEQKEQKQDKSDAPEISFDKQEDESFPTVPVCIGVSVLALAVGVAVGWKQIAATTVAVH